MKIATWNVNSLNVRLPHVLKWISEYSPDIIALQETKITDENFPCIPCQEVGYHTLFSGQRTYNGVAVLSKTKPENPITDIAGFEDPQRRILAISVGDLRVINLYIPNGQSVGSEKYEYKLKWLEKVTEFIQQQIEQFSKVIVLGDFNIAPEARDVYAPEFWEDKVLFSPPERQAFQGLLQSGLVDCFRLFEQPEKSYSWWDYRQLAIRRNMGLRIDHILASSPLKELCVSCIIDKEPRKWERPSDHAPVMAEFRL